MAKAKSRLKRQVSKFEIEDLSGNQSFQAIFETPQHIIGLYYQLTPNAKTLHCGVALTKTDALELAAWLIKTAMQIPDEPAF